MAAGKRVALVTGGTRGIGAAIVRGLASEGFAVAISGRTESSVREAVGRFRKEGIPAAGRAADARREEEQKALIAWVASDFSRLDVLVNNAGIGEFDSVEKLSPEIGSATWSRPTSAAPTTRSTTPRP